jgi:2-(1,2-epoxy-1,2-dihydrophenyl)acetyl-CoA isomerase
VTAYESVPGLDVALDAGVLTLRLSRPEKRNAMDDTMMYAAIDAVDLAGRDEAVRVILLTGAGEHFCSGFDIVARNQEGPNSENKRPRVGSIQRRLPSQAHRLVPLLCSVQTPVVCAVRGWAAGIGLNLALAADFTVAAQDARFWAPFVDRGFTPDSGATWLLPRRIGEVRARDMILLGRVVDGAEAADWQMIHRAVPTADVDATAAELCATLAGGATVALGLSKWLLHTANTSGLDEHLRNEAFAMELSSRSEDFREGLKAFQEKRTPDYGGR